MQFYSEYLVSKGVPWHPRNLGSPLDPPLELGWSRRQWQPSLVIHSHSQVVQVITLQLRIMEIKHHYASCMHIIYRLRGHFWTKFSMFNIIVTLISDLPSPSLNITPLYIFRTSILLQQGGCYSLAITIKYKDTKVQYQLGSTSQCFLYRSFFCLTGLWFLKIKALTNFW